MHDQSIRALLTGLQNKTFSSYELTTECLNKIQSEHNLNAFIHVNASEALAAATLADSTRCANKAALLTGIPMAHKDVFCTETMPTTCGSRMLENFYSPYTATVVKRLAKQGAICVGKTNMDEFAMGSSNQTSYFGAVKNPWNASCVSGGSSGGSAAAVAAGLVPFATGSDTGGSIRQPAAFCGISGLKPTYGRISRFGMVAYASSLDQAGPMARSAEDLSIVFDILSGFDEQDSTSLDRHASPTQHTLHEPPPPLQIGLPIGLLNEHVDSDIRQAIHEAALVFEKMGAKIVEVNPTLQSVWAACYHIIAAAEASSNLARYDGIRFGFQAPNAKTVSELIEQSRTQAFGMEVKRRILVGTHCLSSDYVEDYFIQAQKIRRMIQQEFNHILSTVDVLLSPTTPTCAFQLDHTTNTESPRPMASNYDADAFTVTANLTGLPALSIPAGFSQTGLPIGMQLMGTYFSEARLLQLAHSYQTLTNWHLMKPTHSR